MSKLNKRQLANKVRRLKSLIEPYQIYHRVLRDVRKVLKVPHDVSAIARASEVMAELAAYKADMADARKHADTMARVASDKQHEADRLKELVSDYERDKRLVGEALGLTGDTAMIHAFQIAAAKKQHESVAVEPPEPGTTLETLAVASYSFADAMLAERSKTSTPPTQPCEGMSASTQHV